MRRPTLTCWSFQRPQASSSQWSQWRKLNLLSVKGAGALYVDPVNAGVIYLTRIDPTDTDGQVTLLKTLDGGKTVTTITTSLKGCGVSDLIGVPANPSVFYLVGCGSLWKSMDGGFHWSRLAPAYWASLDPADPLVLYIHDNASYWKSVDGGHFWYALDVPGGRQPPSALVFDPRNHLHVYSVAGQNLFHSEDGGETWQSLTLDQGFTSWEIFVQPGSSGALFVQGWSIGADGKYSVRILQSMDSGQTWSTFLDGDLAYFSLEFDRNDPSIVYGVATTRHDRV
jgi:hypothetical protein